MLRAQFVFISAFLPHDSRLFCFRPAPVGPHPIFTSEGEAGLLKKV
jgi:hypothetical protein